jgi:sortase A
VALRPAPVGAGDAAGNNSGTAGVERRSVSAIGQPTRPEAVLTRAELRRATSVHQVQASQTAAAPAPSEGVVLTIPWPEVPATEDSDPRRRIPVGAILTGILGELLITAGVILGLYVVWELVWSTVEARPQQAHALVIVHERSTYVPPVAAEDVVPDDPAEPLVFAPEYTTDFPEAAMGPTGQPWLSLHVPRWSYDYNVAIAEGIEDPVIDAGLIGHYPETQAAGALGNFATAAHRITHGEPYARIQELRIGDELIVETDEHFLVYEMYDHSIVEPTDMSVLWPVPGQAGVEPGRRLITLTTCHPRYTSTHRYIVWGELQYWTKKSEGPLRALTPPELRGEAGCAMYGALWRVLPGPRWFRAFTLLCLALVAVWACFEYLFPWMSDVLPFNELTVEEDLVDDALAAFTAPPALP